MLLVEVDDNDDDDGQTVVADLHIILLKVREGREENTEHVCLYETKKCSG